MAAAKVARHETRKIVRPHPITPPAPPVVVQDELAVEEPLELRVADEPIAILLRTPGDDQDLAAGFLYTRGLIRSEKDVKNIWHKPGVSNTIHIQFEDGMAFDRARLERNLFLTSDSTVTSRAALDLVRSEPKPPPAVRIRIETLYDLAIRLRKARTHLHPGGGMHAAAIFDLKGTLHMFREDVERLNAIDKSIGAMLLQGRALLENYVLVCTGRTGFEAILKAVRARIPVVCSNTAPTSFAVETAREGGITLVCILPGEEMNVYTHAERIEV
ncbi:MAG: formate dehydrogenase accessory sulfurtransferase FdhD [Planctomycetes bacterium]|nr:formate dehydrogenase accessory sulfurtransferase FdhD [Planctomycetota bacterium]